MLVSVAALLAENQPASSSAKIRSAGNVSV